MMPSYLGEHGRQQGATMRIEMIGSTNVDRINKQNPPRRCTDLSDRSPHGWRGADDEDLICKVRSAKPFKQCSSADLEFADNRSAIWRTQGSEDYPSPQMKHSIATNKQVWLLETHVQQPWLL